MSNNTIAHRRHAHHHVPVMPIFAVIVAILLATVVIWAVNQPQSTTITTTTAAVSAPLIQPAAVTAPESPVFRHAQMRVNTNGGYPRAYVVNMHHLVSGTTLDLADDAAGHGDHGEEVRHAHQVSPASTRRSAAGGGLDKGPPPAT